MTSGKAYIYTAVASVMIVFCVAAAILAIAIIKHKRSTLRAAIESAPLSIACRIEGPMAQQYEPWALSVGKDGVAKLQVGILGERQRDFTVSTSQLTEFRRALVNEQLFDLENEYGRDVPDGGPTTLSVTVGHINKSIYMQYSDPSNRTSRRASERVGRLIVILAGWCRPHAGAARLAGDERIPDS